MHLVVCQNWHFFLQQHYGNLTECLEFHEIEEPSMVMSGNTFLWQLGLQQQHTVTFTIVESKADNGHGWPNFQGPEDEWQVCQTPGSLQEKAQVQCQVCCEGCAICESREGKNEVNPVIWFVFFLCVKLCGFSQPLLRCYFGVFR